MIRCNDWPVGVCTWSLGNDFEKIDKLRTETGLGCIHLDIKAKMPKDIQSWQITATMISFPQEDYSTLEAIKATGGIVPEKHWEENKKSFLAAIAKTADLGVSYLSFHAGFLSDTDANQKTKFLDKIRFLADAAAGKHVMLLMETGQETADELRDFLEGIDHPAVGVNFDPANMILYNKDVPTEAVRILLPWIKHVHIKDAVRTQVPGQWGTEVPWSDGEVNAADFLDTLKEIGFKGVLAIEREAGNSRFEDIRLAVDRLKTSG
ncbi:MAG: sugar phosphate isomerase/epimerase family protein [Planctomycetota bacterium]